MCSLMNCCAALRGLAILCLDEVLSSKCVWSARETKWPIESGVPGARVKESWFSVAAISSVELQIWFFLLALFFLHHFNTFSFGMGVSFYGEYFEMNKIESRHTSVSISLHEVLCCHLGFDRRLFEPLQFPKCRMLFDSNPPWTKSHASCMINNGFVSWCGRSLI